MDLQVALNSLASEVFRDQADADYVTARAAWRMRLKEQFLWASLQAIEKYLKGILLFNGFSSRWPPGSKDDRSKQYGHHLTWLYDAVETHCRLSTGHTAAFRSFVEQIEVTGISRYLTRSTSFRAGSLRSVDEAVWSLRRFCQFLGATPAETDSKRLKVRAATLRRLKDPELRKRPPRLQITGGRLEKILSLPAADSARAALVWKNHFFGNRVRHTIFIRDWESWLIAPPDRDHFKDPALRKRLEHFILW